MTTPPRIAVTGSTGALGGRVTARLAVQGIPLRLVVRDPSRAPSVRDAEVAVAEYADGTAMAEALDGVGTLFFVSGEEDADRLDQHRTVVAAARAAGVRRVVYTSFLGAHPDATFTFARDHSATEEALRAAGLTTTVLRNSLYMDVLPSLAGDGVIRGPAGDGRFAPIAREDIAATAVAALLDERHDGATYDLTGPQSLSMHDVAGIITAVTGRSVRYEPESLDEAYASRAGYDAPHWEITGWVTSYAAIAAGELDTVSDDVRHVTGKGAMTFEDYLRAAGDSPRT